MMKALVLAGGIPQKYLIYKLKQRGYITVLADYTEHPVAMDDADVFYRQSTLDIEAIKKIAIDENVDLIVTVCTDQALNTVATVSEELGLPCYIDSYTGRNVTNKKYMKKRFAQYGISTAKFKVLEKGDYELSENLTYPLIVKPVDCNSSKGVVKVSDEIELRSALDEACELSRTHNAIVEEFIEGKEISADFAVCDGKAILLCLSESQKIKSRDKFIIFRSVVPAGIEDSTVILIKENAQKIADAFGLKNCPMLVQMLYKDGKVYVIEFSARTGGGLKYRLIKQSSGVDVIDYAIDASLGKAGKVTAEFTGKYIINEFIYPKNGVFDHLEGFDKLKNCGIIENYFAFKNPGTEFNRISSSGDRVAGFTVVADSYEDLCRKYQAAIMGFKVMDTDGNDMARHDLTYPISLRKINRNMENIND